MEKLVVSRGKKSSKMEENEDGKDTYYVCVCVFVQELKLKGNVSVIFE